MSTTIDAAIVSLDRLAAEMETNPSGPHSRSNRGGAARDFRAMVGELGAAREDWMLPALGELDDGYYDSDHGRMYLSLDVRAIRNWVAAIRAIRCAA